MEIEKHFRQKVDVNARCHSGDTALHLAAMHNLPKICTKLLEKADVNAEDDTGRTPLHKAIETESHEAFTVRGPLTPITPSPQPVSGYHPCILVNPNVIQHL